jgi:cytochrome c oxidase subunit 1
MAGEDHGSAAEENTAGDGASLLREGVIGVAAGSAAMAAMTVVLLGGVAIGALDPASTAGLAAIVGLGESRVVGYVLLSAAGVVLWPLLFIAIGERVPGGSAPLRGLSFGTVMWSGFVLAFYAGQSRSALVIYATTTLLAHWAYGFVLGTAFDFLADRIPDFDIGNAPFA